MKNILVTGASGLIGREVTQQLAAQGHKVIALTRDSTDFQNPNVENITMDFESSVEFERSLPGGIEAVIHLAQSDKFRDFPAHAREVFLTNTLSTVGLLDWAKTTGVSHFIYASTGGVYSESGYSSESHTPLKSPGELDFYFSTKLSSESFVQCYSDIFSVAVLRFFFVYGKNQKRAMLMPRLYDSIKSGSPVFLEGPNGFSFNPVHVSDAARALVSSVKNPRSLIANIAGPEILTLRDACEILAKRIGKAPNYELKSTKAVDLVAKIEVMRDFLVEPEVKLRSVVEELEH
jgi:nucleoside-diphosphate-sugar epimerase